MKQFLSKFKDPFLTYALIYCCGMLILHSWQFVHSDYRIEPLIRIINYSLLILFLFIFNNSNWFCIGGLIAASVFLFFQDFTYYMAWWFVILCMNQYKNIKKFIFIIPYVIVVGTVASLHHKNPSHIYIHFLNCGMMYFVDKKSRENKPEYHKQLCIQDDRLELTEDERIIIKELCAGKQQKDIPGFNKNTVSKKLQAAKERNRIKSLSELQYKFLKETELN